jgi:hypothetical protein
MDWHQVLASSEESRIFPLFGPLPLSVSERNGPSTNKVASCGANCAEDTKLVGLTSSMILLWLLESKILIVH